jgi:hypothetical protein
MVLDPDWKRFHTMPPDSNAKQLRFAVRPTVAASHTEMLAFGFTDLKISSARLNLDWGTMHIAMAVAVTPSMRIPIALADVQDLLGRYEFRWLDGPDSVKTTTMTLSHKNGYLMGDTSPNDDWLVNFAFAKVAPDWYAPAFFEKGEIYEVEKTVTFDFKRSASGTITGFEVRDDGDKLIGRGARRP